LLVLVVLNGGLVELRASVDEGEIVFDLKMQENGVFDLEM
jgi:hypothetical protein